jgi:hypothetical protein
MHSNLELVSIHIPKTAGTSFRNILKRVYGRRRVIRIDIRPPSSPNPPPPKKLSNRVKVIHGHFAFPELASLYGIDKNVPIITWVRDPVERVMSNYFYLQRVLRKLVGKGQKELNILNRMEKNLEEFAQAERNRNRMSKFLEGLRLEDLFFVGIQEHFSEDLNDLAKMLHWRRTAEFRHNTSQEQRVPVNNDIKEQIRELNEEDVKVYEEALHLRKLRRSRLEAEPKQ